MLIHKKLEEVRDAVQDVYSRYLSVRDGQIDQVDQVSLAKQVERLRELSILLVVAGEVKSGKSSFVNALLGTPLLPVDTLQSSSAVVEIGHADQRLLEVSYADGHCERIGEDADDWDRDVRETLARVAAVPPQFRDLPVVHLRQIVAGGPDVSLNAVFERLAGNAATNPQGLSLDVFSTRARAFLDAYGAPEQVATRIVLSHPLPHGSALVKVVDTPGVNAVGGIESVTRAYLRDADALLFVQSLATPVESLSFRSFVGDNVGDKLQEALFLILTNASRLNRSDRADRLAEAHRHFDRVVGSRDRVLAVDSVMEEIRVDAKDFESADSLLGHYDDLIDDGGEQAATAEEKAKLLAPLARREADFACLKDRIADDAGFEDIHTALATFATRAPYIQIARALDTIKLGLDNLATSNLEQQALNEQGANDPEDLHRELEARRTEIDQLRDILATEGTAIVDDFTHPADGIVSRAVAAKKSEWVDRLRKAQSEQAMQTVAEVALEEAERLWKDWNRQLLIRCQNALDKHERVVLVSAKFSIPKIDVNAIADQLRPEFASISEKGTAYWKKRIPLFNDIGFQNSLRDHLIKEVASRGSRCREEFKRTVPDVVRQFRTALNEVLDQKNREYDDLEAAHQSAQEYVARATRHSERATSALALVAAVGDLRATIPA